MPGETRRAAFAQPEWLRSVPTDRRLPRDAEVVFTGCGTSFHAAQTGGRAVQALEAVLSPPRADIMVCVSHEGTTALTGEAERAFGGDVWLVTGTPDSELAERVDEVIVCTPELERSWCHTASYTCAVAAIDALNDEEIDWLPDAVEDALAADVQPFEQQRVVVPARAATGRPRRRRRSSCARAPGSTRVLTRPSSSCTATSPRSTSTSGRSCSRARAVRRSARTTRSRNSRSSAARRRSFRRAIRSSTSSISIC